MSRWKAYAKDTPLDHQQHYTPSLYALVGRVRTGHFGLEVMPIVCAVMIYLRIRIERHRAGKDRNEDSEVRHV